MNLTLAATDSGRDPGSRLLTHEPHTCATAWPWRVATWGCLPPGLAYIHTCCLPGPACLPCLERAEPQNSPTPAPGASIPTSAKDFFFPVPNNEVCVWAGELKKVVLVTTQVQNIRIGSLSRYSALLMWKVTLGSVFIKNLPGDSITAAKVKKH